MSEEEVRRAVHAAARLAFAMGLAAPKGRPADQQREEARRYAEDLVMPIAEAAIEQAREEGFAAARTTPLCPSVT